MPAKTTIAQRLFLILLGLLLLAPVAAPAVQNTLSANPATEIAHGGSGCLHCGG